MKILLNTHVEIRLIELVEINRRLTLKQNFLYHTEYRERINSLPLKIKLPDRRCFRILVGKVGRAWNHRFGGRYQQGRLIPQAISLLLKKFLEEALNMANIRLNNGSNESSKNGNNGSNNDWYEEFVCKALPERLRCCRKYWGWNQEELAYRVGISQTSLSKIEAGKSQPSIDTLVKMEKALEVPEGYLYAEIKSIKSGNKAKAERNAEVEADNRDSVNLVSIILKEIQENKFSIEQLENIRFTIHEYSRLNKLLGCSA